MYLWLLLRCYPFCVVCTSHLCLNHPHLLYLLPLRPTVCLQYSTPTSPTTISPPVPPGASMPPDRGLQWVELQCSGPPCSTYWRFRSPVTLSPHPSSVPPAVVNANYRRLISGEVAPWSISKPSGGTPPGYFPYRGFPPTFTTRKGKFPVPPKGRTTLKPACPTPTAQGYATGVPMSVLP